MSEATIKFMSAGAETNLADDPKIALLAVCVISQQDAGFKDKAGNKVVDLRQADCVCCGAPGFNTGWGYWRHTCGAEIMPDGDMSEPCSKYKAEHPEEFKD